MGACGFAVEFSIRKARLSQACLAKEVIEEDRLPKQIGLVGGVDAAYARDWAFGAAVVLDYGSLEFREVQTTTQRVEFPYVPTLLPFGELPVAAACIRKLRLQPDVLLVEGHGKARPYRCGLASHLGVTWGKTTVGVAKNRLVGEPKRIGENVFLVQNGEVVGAVVITCKGTKPVYVSVGHMVSLSNAVEIVKHCNRVCRVPEPIRLAHRPAVEERKAKNAVDANTV